MSSFSRKPLSGTAAATTAKAQREQVKNLEATISILDKELSDLKQKLEIRENDNKNLLETKQKNENYIKYIIRITVETLAGKQSIIDSKVFRISELHKKYEIISTSDNNYIDPNTKAQRGVKTLKATILSLEDKLSDLKQRLKISENDNRYLLETKQKNEECLKMIIEARDKALDIKDKIICSKDNEIFELVKKHGTFDDLPLDLFSIFPVPVTMKNNYNQNQIINNNNDHNNENNNNNQNQNNNNIDFVPNNWIINNNNDHNNDNNYNNRNQINNNTDFVPNNWIINNNNDHNNDNNYNNQNQNNNNTDFVPNNWIINNNNDQNNDNNYNNRNQINNNTDFPII
ncbi:12296_t:CDS:2 [Ambispora gerdemannii]|uniref:12296_t:CDS:1 n=1 Tax=Ambispora gerdemannii TaxID=144530 RepID=A0A9N9DCP0_9GLOM|nr:12296_t:CDS:2 [Ambispora gerdemannii]